MATPESAVPSAPPSERVPLVFRIISILSVVALVVFLGGVGWFYLAARRALPQLDGRIEAPGITHKVRVVRDPHGVPHITAANLQDLFFAQGYVTAQDRLWQMDGLRRYAGGELAEVMGEGLLASDLRQRVLLTRLVAERSAAGLSPRERSYLDAYSRGVNAFIESHRDRLPMEFRVLRYSPKPWTISDSLLIGVHMCQLLNHGLYATELQREKILEKLGPDLTADLYPTRSWRDRAPAEPPTPPPSAAAPASANAGTLPFPVTNVWLHEPSLAPGSNNWVISGAHTATGRPLLSNDMHLPHSIPGIWYEVHLKVEGATLDPGAGADAQADFELAQGFDVAGVALPGLPAVVVGHNQRIAWGFTNLAPDVEDVVIETFNDKGEYLTPKGWERPLLMRTTIHVKDKPDVKVDVPLTRHGPIVTPLVPGEKRKLALQWAIYDPTALSLPFVEVNAAKDWNQFRLAFSRFNMPGQNVVYADVDGHIGYQATGRVPIRKHGDGSVPVAGEAEQADWAGYVPFDKLPSVYDPPSGILATANGRIVPDGYPYHVASQWGGPERAQRIYQVLESGKRFTTADMLALQADVQSDMERFFAQQFAAAIARRPAASDRLRAAGKLLAAWDGRVTKEAAAPTLQHFARMELLRLLLAGKGGEPIQYSWWMSEVFLENVLRERPQRWLPQQFQTYDDLLVAAVEGALKHRDSPRDLDAWRWGRQFPVALQHPVFTRIPLIRRWAAPGIVEQSGSGMTVKQVGRAFGPSMRMTVDFSDLDASTLNVVTGQSGQIFSPHYLDHWDAWYNDRTFRLPFSDRAVAAARRHELTLEPKP